MPVYVYRAINEEGKEVHGTIESPDIETARNALVHDMHLEPLDVQEPTRIRREQKPNEDDIASRPALLTFSFEGTDPTGYARRGTIQAESKRSAFEKLKRDQKLHLSLLSPMGREPDFHDADLVEWQKDTPLTVEREHFELKPVMSVQGSDALLAATTQSASVPAQSIPREPALPPTPSTHDQAKPSVRERNTSYDQLKKRSYAPLLSTIRLYCGWLIAWYGLFVGLGHYAHVRETPIDLSIAEGFYLSPLIFTIVLAIFLFMLFNSLHRFLKAGTLGGIGFAVIGTALFAFLRFQFA